MERKIVFLQARMEIHTSSGATWEQIKGEKELHLNTLDTWRWLKMDHKQTQCNKKPHTKKKKEPPHSVTLCTHELAEPNTLLCADAQLAP